MNFDKILDDSCIFLNLRSFVYEFLFIFELRCFLIVVEYNLVWMFDIYLNWML